jgi:FkbM family methyltransferase
MKKTIKYALDYLVNNPKKIYKFFFFAWYKIFNISPVRKIDDGFKMKLDLNAHVDRNIFFNGGVDIPLHNFIVNNSKDIRTFVDIGANSGYFSLLLAQNNKVANIFAFEPVPHTFKKFKSSVDINKFVNINVLQQCVGDKDGEIDFYISHSSDVSGCKITEFHSNSKKIKVKINTFDTIVKTVGIKEIDLIKIDTEGAELGILNNAINSLNEFRPVMVIEFSNKTTAAYGYHPSDIYNFLVKNNYQIFNFDGKSLRLQALEDYYDINLYCIPEEKVSKYVK